IVAIAATIGLAGSVASRTMDVNYTRVPDSVRGRVIAWVELGFQLANVTGAVLAVSAAPSPRLGFAVVAVVLVLAALATASRMRVSLRREAGRWLLGTPIATDALDLPFALLAEAVRVSERGDHRMAVVVADAAVRVASVADDSASTGALPAPEWIAVAGLVAAVVAGRTEASAATVVRVVEAADAAVRAMRPAVDPAVDPASSAVVGGRVLILGCRDLLGRAEEPPAVSASFELETQGQELLVAQVQVDVGEHRIGHLVDRREPQQHAVVGRDQVPVDVGEGFVTDVDEPHVGHVGDRSDQIGLHAERDGRAVAPGFDEDREGFGIVGLGRREPGDDRGVDRSRTIGDRVGPRVFAARRQGGPERCRDEAPPRAATALRRGSARSRHEAEGSATRHRLPAHGAS
ncbi:MAG: hypothetical protein R2713_22880, partial [Ilumatobacteraceae bacterium]